MVSPTRRRGVHSSKRPPGPDMKEMLFPSMGYRALGRWFLLKMVRQSHNPHKIAMGAAIGMWVNFLPFPGFGGLLAMALAFLFRVSVPVAFIAQIPSNPFTFPILWWLTYVTGMFVMPISIDGITFHTLMQNFNWTYFNAHWWELLQGVLLTMFIGGQILGLVSGFITYKIMYRQVEIFWGRRRSHQARLRALEEAFAAERAAAAKPVAPQAPQKASTKAKLSKPKPHTKVKA